MMNQKNLEIARNHYEKILESINSEELTPIDRSLILSSIGMMCYNAVIDITKTEYIPQVIDQLIKILNKSMIDNCNERSGKKPSNLPSEEAS